ncbi:MAG: glutathione S-transferase family protein [Pseudomonadota bacterium]
MPYVLYNRLGSGGFPVEVMLSACGLDYTYEPLDSVPSSDLGTLIDHVNKWRQVPVLETPDGQVITETAAILAYLDQTEAACRAGPHLWNDSPGQFLRWCVFLSVNVYESILRRIYGPRYIDLTDCSDEDAKALCTRVGRAGRDRAHQALLFVQENLGDKPFLLGERMSAADLYLAMVTAWHRRHPDLPKLASLAERVATHREVRGIWQRNFGHRLQEQWQDTAPEWS